MSFDLHHRAVHSVSFALLWITTCALTGCRPNADTERQALTRTDLNKVAYAIEIYYSEHKSVPGADSRDEEGYLDPIAVYNAISKGDPTGRNWVRDIETNQEWTARGTFIDRWGSGLGFKIVTGRPVERDSNGTQEAEIVLVWSIGKNRINENGFGDDIGPLRVLLSSNALKTER